MIRRTLTKWFPQDVEEKATSATPAHQALIGTRPRPFMLAFEQPRVLLSELVKRYGRWVQRCIDINAGTAASIEPRLFSIGNSEVVTKSVRLRPKKLDPRTKAFMRGRLEIQPGSVAMKKIQGMTDDMVEITDHPFLDLLSDVNPWEEGYSFRHSWYADLQIFGRYFTLLVGPDGQPPINLVRLLPHKIKIIRDPVDFVGGYIYGSGPDKQTFSPDEVLWHKLYDPADPWGGIGPVEAWLNAIDADFAIEAFQKWLYTRGGTPDFVIRHKAMMDAPQKREMLSEWRRKFGDLRRRVANLMFFHATDPNDSIDRLSETNRELQFTDSKKDARDEIAQGTFGVSKAIITADDVNRANAREASPTHMRYTISPMVRRNEDVLNQRLLPKWSDNLVLIHDNPIPEDRTIRIQERRSLLDSGGTINEAREADGLEPLTDPKADEPLVAAGLQLVSKLGEESFGLFGGGGGGRRDGDNDGLINEGGKSSNVAYRLMLDDFLNSKGTNKPASRLLQGMADEMLGEHATANGHITSHAKLWLEYYAGQADSHLSCKDEGGRQSGISPEGVPGFAEATRRYLNEQLEAIANDLRVRGIEGASTLLRDPKWLEQLSETIRPSVQVAIDRGGIAGMDKLPGVAPFDVESLEVQQFIDEYTVRLAQAVNGTTELALRQIMVDGLEQDRSVREISNTIIELDNEVSGFRAERIARTESTRAFVEGEKEAWKLSGVVQGKTWLLAPGACEFCRALKAQFGNDPIPLDQPFYQQGHLLVGVEGGRLRLDYSDVVGPPLHPHDRCDLLPVLTEQT